MQESTDAHTYIEQLQITSFYYGNYCEISVYNKTVIQTKSISIKIYGIEAKRANYLSI